MQYLVQRNLFIFFKNKKVVAGSMISSSIILLLYSLFLGDSIAKDYGSIDQIEILINVWMMAGFASLTSITSVITPISQIIRDRESYVMKDLIATRMSNFCAQ